MSASAAVPSQSPDVSTKSDGYPMSESWGLKISARPRIDKDQVLPSGAITYRAGPLALRSIDVPFALRRTFMEPDSVKSV